jgi:hypothetical protein
MDWWRRLPGFVRIPIAVVILLVATALFFNPPTVTMWRGVFLLFALGMILLFTGPTDAQQKGYHDI